MFFCALDKYNDVDSGVWPPQQAGRAMAQRAEAESHDSNDDDGSLACFRSSSAGFSDGDEEEESACVVLAEFAGKLFKGSDQNPRAYRLFSWAVHRTNNVILHHAFAREPYPRASKLKTRGDQVLAFLNEFSMSLMKIALGEEGAGAGD